MIPIELEIDELVVRGIDAQQAEPFVAALRAELAAALLPEAVRASLHSRGDVSSPGPSDSVVLPAAESATALGRSAGRLVAQEVIR